MRKLLLRRDGRAPGYADITKFRGIVGGWPLGITENRFKKYLTSSKKGATCVLPGSWGKYITGEFQLRAMLRENNKFPISRSVINETLFSAQILTSSADINFRVERVRIRLFGMNIGWFLDERIPKQR